MAERRWATAVASRRHGGRLLAPPPLPHPPTAVPAFSSPARGAQEGKGAQDDRGSRRSDWSGRRHALRSTFVQPDRRRVCVQLREVMARPDGAAHYLVLRLGVRTYHPSQLGRGPALSADERVARLREAVRPPGPSKGAAAAAVATAAPATAAPSPATAAAATAATAAAAAAAAATAAAAGGGAAVASAAGSEAGTARAVDGAPLSLRRRLLLERLLWWLPAPLLRRYARESTLRRWMDWATSSARLGFRVDFVQLGARVVVGGPLELYRVAESRAEPAAHWAVRQPSAR